MEGKKALNYDELEKVSGGASLNEKILTVELDLTRCIWTGDINIKVYVDGELDRSKCVTVDRSVHSRSFAFAGIMGTKSVRFKCNDYISLYQLDFDAQTVTLI